MKLSLGGRDDAGSMPIAVLLTIVAVALSAVISSTAIIESNSVRQNVLRTRLINAAQAGLDVAVALIRDAIDAAGAAINQAAGDDTIPGDLTKLPCGPLTGPVGAGSSATYAVTITYETVSDAAIGCINGAGTAQTPHHTVLNSTGVEGNARRALSAEYVVSTVNQQNIAGGLIHTYTGPDYCFDAGSAQPPPGALLFVRPCSKNSDEQKFAYTNTLSLRLVSSVTDTRPLGLCVQAGPTPHPAFDVAATLQPCVTPTPAAQKWTYNTADSFEGTSNGTTNDGHCLRTEFPGQTGRVLLRTSLHSCDLYATNYQNWIPDGDVGAGMAGGNVLNLVNYFQFGRCLDVPAFDINHPFMWAWPCKQDPGGNLDWNQQWELCAHAAGPCSTKVPSTAQGTSGILVTRPGSAPWQTCLKSTLTNIPRSYPTLVTCPANPTASTRWTIYGNTGVYATSYRIVDSMGNCLAVENSDDPTSSGWQLGRISVVATVRCTGSSREKWNADPIVLRPTPLINFTER